MRKCAKTNFAFDYGFFAFWVPAVWDPSSGPKIVPREPFLNEKHMRTETPKKMQFLVIGGRASRAGFGDCAGGAPLPRRHRNPPKNARVHPEPPTVEATKSMPKQTVSSGPSYRGSTEIHPKTRAFTLSRLPWTQEKLRKTQISATR